MIPFAAQFDSLKFSVILGTHEGHNGHSWKGLISPFGSLVWVTVLLAMFLLSRFFGMFSVVSIFLEKGHTSTKSLRREAACNLILLWLFCSFLIRNFYTSQMYSHLTKFPDPTNLPKSIKELFYNKTMPILCEPHVEGRSLMHIESVNQGKNISSLQLDPSFSTFKKLRVIRTQHRVLQFLSDVSDSRDIPCEAFPNGSRLFRKNREDVKCKTSDRFALMSYSIGAKEAYSIRFLLPLFELLGNRQIYNMVNDLSFMTNSLMWFGTKLFYWEQVQLQIGYLVDSGIYNWLVVNYDIKKQANILKNLMKDVGLGKGMNFYAFSLQKVKQNRNTVGKTGLAKTENLFGTRYAAVELRQLQNVFTLCFLLITGCIVYFICELVLISHIHLGLLE
ncbi:unnamed protein product [Orchesella dallaii]|uniref:Uncharacterized protein n=1 Tax=Orchesella dallaii TaxID=48710 RepID=A0ABP1PI55_9HEXA